MILSPQLLALILLMLYLSYTLAIVIFLMSNVNQEETTEVENNEKPHYE